MTNAGTGSTQATGGDVALYDTYSSSGRAGEFFVLLLLFAVLGTVVLDAYAFSTL